MPADNGSVLLIQFAKEPVAGRVKTRMQPHLSPDEACALHSELLRWTCANLCRSQLGDVELWVSGAARHAVFADCESMGLSQLREQQGSDLGARMYHAIHDGLTRYNAVVLVGSDCPAIDTQYIASALGALNRSELVLGPAHDGGYVLIAATHIHAGLFEGVAWGEAQVFAQTQMRAQKLGITTEVLAPLHDIDRPEDLSRWQSLHKP